MAEYNSPERELVENCEENDGNERNCVVWLYTRHLAEISKRLGDDASSLLPGPAVQHWALVFKFEEEKGNRVLTFEGMANDDNIIKAYRTCGAYSNCGEHEFGEVKTSPETLLNLAKDHQSRMRLTIQFGGTARSGSKSSLP